MRWLASDFGGFIAAAYALAFVLLGSVALAYFLRWRQARAELLALEKGLAQAAESREEDA